MKLIDTLTSQDKINMLNGNAVGIFPSLILQDDPYYSKIADLCTGYYLHRSGSKTISPSYSRFIELCKEDGIVDTPNFLLGKYIRGTFNEKWTRIYNALIAEQYSVLDDHDYNIIKTANNSDTVNYNTEVKNDGNTSSKETTQRDVTDNEDRYGFNSAEAVGDTKSTESETETTTALAEDNTSSNTQKKTGTDETNYSVDENVNSRGRKISGAKMIMEELDLRNKQIFFDIIYRDIDSIATLQIYI